MYKLIFVLLFILFVCLPVLVYKSRPKKQYTDIPQQNEMFTKHQKKFNGLVLFDVDGTLTTGKNNEEVVQLCLDKGWAVGICTAGRIYSMDNLLTYEWMPKNLYEFIKMNDNITFNNVASGILAGKLDIQNYNSVYAKTPYGIDKWGYLKGFALKYTGNLLGILDSSRLILCDDLKVFMSSALMYDPDLIMICSGSDCGGTLSLENLKKYVQ